MSRFAELWLRGVDLNHRPLGYEPNELPDCSTPRKHRNRASLRESNRGAVPDGRTSGDAGCERLLFGAGTQTREVLTRHLRLIVDVFDAGGLAVLHRGMAELPV